MKAVLDGEIIFDERLELAVDSWQRAVLERMVAGLDGVLSMDLGQRSRRIRQKGLLRAASDAALTEKINRLTGCMDGLSHSLATDGGDELEDLRIDGFTAGPRQASGSSVCCSYELLYSQLGG
jgi:hypothetical protein